MQIDITNVLERMMPIVLLVPLGYTIFYFFPRYYNFSKYKTMQLLFLIGFLMAGIIFIPLINNRVLSAQGTSVLALFIVYDSAILFFTFYLFKGKIDSIAIFFIKRDDVKKLISDVLLGVGWSGFQITDNHLDSIKFSDPQSYFTIQAMEKEDRFIVIPQVLDVQKNSEPGSIRRFSMNLKYELNKYPPDADMVSIFRRKNLKFLIVLWGLFIIFQVARIIIK